MEAEALRGSDREVGRQSWLSLPASSNVLQEGDIAGQELGGGAERKG